MTETVLWTDTVKVYREEANFDRACNQAFGLAFNQIGLDEDGGAELAGWDRASCRVAVSFSGYGASIGMDGPTYVYEFDATAIKFTGEGE
jgi:hypothetical protein